MSCKIIHKNYIIIYNQLQKDTAILVLVIENRTATKAVKSYTIIKKKDKALIFSIKIKILTLLSNYSCDVHEIIVTMLYSSDKEKHKTT